jgi:hypothetical protein
MRFLPPKLNLGMKSSQSSLIKGTSGKVVNLALYKVKKALSDEGFEVVEDPDGKITLVIRVAK